ncbi:YisL family protein [Metabacillus sediminilitoris]|jgi:membrane protein insertase Oxa1/YidC/SpoIIIJ|uniref:UPF0344 protein E6W99_11260 n=1 Tax=Metabacillus sediminilitoris TaxID=2567941 RepID=A0A4S4BYK7_9BACI|nr:YisL family protein [Metabacillus sediminilitoris]QGQ44612.1 DUF1516 family protein [Metabacillus sediminilitoris]THF80239.1 DUF1516 family protein [Metabacillus sediminilitoris]
MTHAHITTWVVAIILFFVAHSLLKSQKEKPAKIVQMVLRLFYILIIVTGIMIASGIQLNGEYIGKIILGIVTIGMMEMVLTKTKKGQPTKVFWIIFIVVLILTISLGLRLPFGFAPFA